MFAFLGLVLTCRCALAADGPSGFDAANQLYEQGRFAEAAQAYEQLIRSGSSAPSLFFNAGNAHFKCGEIGRAVAAYRQAERIAPRDPDLRANLQFVRNQVQGPTLRLNRWQQWLAKLTVNEWTALASVGLWTWLGLLIVAQVRPAWKPALRTLIWLSGAATVSLCLCLGTAFAVDSSSTAVVIAHEAAVRNGPLEESKPAFTAHDGAELIVLDRKNDWLQVEAGDRSVGWVKSDQVLLTSRQLNRSQSP